jgi:hypothetical protein
VAEKGRNILLRVESSLADAAVAWLTAKRIVVYALATLLLMHHGFVYDLILLTLPLLLLFPWLSEISPYYKIYLVLLYFIPYVLLIFPRLPFDPIQPLLMALCFEVYRVHSRSNIECVLQSA